MITSPKNYTKTKQNKTKHQTIRTLGQMAKAKLYRQNHTKHHINIHKKRKGKYIYIYIYIYIYKIKKEESNQIDKQIYQ